MGGDGEDIFVVVAPNVEVPQNVAQELSGHNYELVRARGGQHSVFFFLRSNKLNIYHCHDFYLFEGAK